jgi:hypothetical protein
MGGSVKVPGPSAEEKDLQKNQAQLLGLQREIIEQQRAQSAVLIPFFAEQEGFQVETDEKGNITKIHKTPSELENINKTLELEMAQRSLQALRGELPVSPGLERELGQQEQTLKQQLSAQFGPGFETSSPGIEATEKFRQTSEVLREGARTAQLTLSEQLGMARSQQNQFTRASSSDALRQSAVGDPMTFAGAFGQSASGFGQAQQPYIQQRQMQLQASIANQQAKTAMFGAGIGMIGSMFSDERLKSDAEQIGELLPWGLPIYEFAMNGERYVGVFASDAELVAPGLIGERYGYKTVQYEDL